MNPVQVNCPECQKLFVVREEDLTTEQPKFQCTGCAGLFTFEWPQQPGVIKILPRKLQPDFKQAPLPPKAKATQTCINCNAKCDADYQECPKCGVIFEKVKKIRPPQPIQTAQSPQILSAWEDVKNNYVDVKKHESFIQLCLGKDNLVFASSRYKAVLLANPHDDIALRMQNRIIEIATQTYLGAHAHKAPAKRRGLFTYALSSSAVLMIVGLVFPQARSLIAVGCAVIVFVLSLRYFGK